MKKFLFLLGGVMTLASCSNDASDWYSERSNQESVSHYQPLTVTAGYDSPWDVNNTFPITYQFDSNEVNTSWYDWINNKHVQGLYVRITPYLGIAYHDGVNDGVYNVGGVINLGNGHYPNLFANGEEYGNYVQGNPIVLANQHLTGIGGWYTHELNIWGEYHSPVINVLPHINMNIYGVLFDIVNNHVVQPTTILGGTTISPAPSPGTSQEEALLKDYGKVFYYKIEYGTDPYTFYDDVYYVLALEANDTYDTNEWTEILATSAAHLNDTFNAHMYFHNITNEVVVNPDDFFEQQDNYKASHEEFDISDGSTRKVITQGHSGSIMIYLY